MARAMIEVEGLGKCYRRGGQQRALSDLRESLLRAITWPFRKKRERGERDFWALRDVSFSVEEGEIVGIIGSNGAGKSTLLKILSRITRPTEGKAELHGRVGSLLEVGTGFHPELTGRENVYFSGAVLGMKEAEIKSQFDAIVDFSGVEEFLDTPVKHYSSGMRVRLGFAVAAHLNPEILLVDEVLAVGDAAFQKKCLGKMGEVARGGRTVLFVSHNMAAIQNLCTRCLCLYRGHVSFEGTATDSVAYYLRMMQATVDSCSLRNRTDRAGNGRIRLCGHHFEDEEGGHCSALQSGKNVTFVFDYETSSGQPLKNVSVGFGVSALNGQLLFVLYSSYTAEDFASVPPSGQFRCRLPRLNLSPGRYLLGARVLVDGVEADWPNDGIGHFDVEAGDFFGTGSLGFGAKAPFLVDGNWSLGG
jgi:homopolymeric O-antigen transport system ATP-binding protein